MDKISKLLDFNENKYIKKTDELIYPETRKKFLRYTFLTPIIFNI